MKVLLKDNRIVDLQGNSKDEGALMTKAGERINFEDVVRVIERLPFFIRIFQSLFEGIKSLFKKNTPNANEETN